MLRVSVAPLKLCTVAPSGPDCTLLISELWVDSGASAGAGSPGGGRQNGVLFPDTFNLTPRVARMANGRGAKDRASSRESEE